MDNQEKNRKKYSPPGWLDKIIIRVCAPHLHEEILGDLHERFLLKTDAVGLKKARKQYWREVLSYLSISNIKRKPSYYSHLNFMDMIRNYFIVAIRNLVKYKGFSFINIAGLALGIASFILIGIFIYHELSFDNYHKNKENIYRIVEDLKTDNELLFQSTSSPPMGPAFKREFPEVKDFVRFQQYRGLVTNNEQKFYEDNCYMADHSVFDIFSYKMINGNPKTALVEPNTVVLTKSMATKYFGNDSPLDKSLSINGNEFKVTGVIEDLPSNSHFVFDLLSSFSTFASKNAEVIEKGWYWNGFHTYLLIEEGKENIANVRTGMGNFIEKNIGGPGDGNTMFYQDLPLQQLGSIYLETPRSWENGKRGSESNLYILAYIAIFILLIAAFNYVNLATARASRRLKEVGLRKVLGAERKSLVFQFLGESIAVSFISFSIAILLVYFLLPFFNDLLASSLTFSLINSWELWAGFILMAILLGILSGAYPAFLVSGFHPLLVFRKSHKSIYGNNLLRRILVSGQFMISIMLIAGTIIVHRQLNHMQQMKLGFEKERTLKLNFNGSNSIIDRLETIKTEFNALASVAGVTGSYSVPGEGTTNLYTSMEIEKGKMSYTNMNTYLIDHDFIPNYSIELLAGRNFSRDFPADDSTAFIVNETAVKDFGWTGPQEAIGRKVIQRGKRGVIIGVIKDFHYESVKSQVAPLLLYIQKEWFQNLSIKIDASDMVEAVSEIETKWRELAPNLPFLYSFIDEDFDKLYKAEKQLSYIVGIFSGLAIFVACLGLIGLTAFSVERRYKEIGIRKVLGANVVGLVLMISNEFFKLIIVALVLAVPVTYIVLTKWLQNFTVSIEISPWVFAIAGLVTLVIAWLGISILSIRAAQTNPVDSLQNE